MLPLFLTLKRFLYIIYGMENTIDKQKTSDSTTSQPSTHTIEVTPKVSVIIPVMEDSAHLRENLVLLKSQTFRFFEAIIVYIDENTKIQVEEIASGDKHFKTVKCESLSLIQFYDAGLNASRGEYILFVTAKGRFKDQPTMLNNFYSAATGRRSDLVVGRLVNDHVMMREPITLELSKTEETSSLYSDLTGLMDFSSVLIRRELLVQEDFKFTGDDNQSLFLIKALAIAGARVVTGYDNDVLFTSKSSPLSKIYNASVSLSPFNISGARKVLSILKLALDRRVTLEREIRDKEPVSEKTKTETEYLYEKLRSCLIRFYLNEVIINGYLRNIWLLDTAIHEEIEAVYNECLDELFDTDKAKLFDENRDLHLKDGFPAREKMAKYPEVSIVFLHQLVKGEDVPNLIKAYYSQALPVFELAVDEALAEYVPLEVRNMPNYTTIDPGDNPEKFHKEKMPSLRGKFVTFAESGILPEYNTILLQYRAIMNKSFVSSPLLKNHKDILVPQKSNEGAFVRRFCYHKLHTAYNKLDLFWGNKLFNCKKMINRKLFFTGNTQKDLYRIYTSASFEKFPPVGFVTTLSDSQIISRTRDIIVRLRYKHYLNIEHTQIQRYEKESHPAKSYARRARNLRIKTIRRIFQFITLKILYPMYYSREARKPLKENKVIFMVPKHPYITPGISVMYDTIKNSGKYEITVHYMNKLNTRLIETYKKSSAFVKDIATAKYIFMDDSSTDFANLKMRPQTHVVQLWHGCGAFKKFGFSTADKLFGGSALTQKMFRQYANYTLLTVSSPEVVWAYEEAMFYQGKNVVQPLGISRTDVFYDEEYITSAKDRVLELAPFARGKKIILYAPTFRGRVGNPYGPDRLDYDRLYEELGDEYVILVKQHPLVSRPPEIPERYRGSFALDLTVGSDISDMLCAADICISDYSSLVFEYSLLERPLIFFAYDLDTYFDWRGFYYDYFEMAPGPVVSNTEEIVDYIKHIDERFDLKRMQDFRYKFMRSCDGHATERILDYIGLKL